MRADDRNSDIEDTLSEVRYKQLTAECCVSGPYLASTQLSSLFIKIPQSLQSASHR